MRSALWLAGALAGLWTAGGAHAQTASTLTGNVVTPLQFKIIGGDTSNSPIGGPFNRSNTILNSFVNLFPKSTRMANRQILPQTAFPTPSQMPGKNYFWYFRMMQAKRLPG